MGFVRNTNTIGDRMANDLVSEREIVEFIAAVRALMAEVKETNDSIRQLREDIHGNGKPGLKHEVAELRDQITRLELRLKLVYGAAMVVFGPMTAYTAIQVFQYGVDLLTHWGKPPIP